MKFRIFKLVLLYSLSLILSLPANAAEMEVAAVAAGIAPCVQEIMDLYVSSGNTPLSIVTGPCGTLAKQAEAGSPYGMVLMSEPRWPQWMKDRDLLVDLDTFAIGQLVLWSPKEDLPSLEGIKDRIVAIPDPETTAYGMAAKNYLTSMDMWESFSSGKTIPAKSAPQAVVAAESGAAQWAFIPMSAALKAGGTYMVLDGATLPQVGGLSPSAGESAKSFWKFCRSDETSSIWLKWGFLLEKNR